MSLYEFEDEHRRGAAQCICGVDEAGRGPLAGAVYAAAVILPQEPRIEGLNDSKKLSAKKREALFEEIINKAVAFNICAVDEHIIDEINILEATMRAMREAVLGLKIKPDMVYIDGNRCPDLGSISSEFVIGGDAISASIAAASILAKVSRDSYMAELAKVYPQYFFEKHKGYGTALHYEMLDKYGASPVHRLSFLKKWGAAK
ncbi:MAG: ribonuclease HII [Hydrogenoanaerobacterium sp.]